MTHFISYIIRGAKNMRKIERGDSSTRAREREDKKGIRNESKRGKKKTGEGKKSERGGEARKDMSSHTVDHSVSFELLWCIDQVSREICRWIIWWLHIWKIGECGNEIRRCKTREPVCTWQNSTARQNLGSVFGRKQRVERNSSAKNGQSGQRDHSDERRIKKEQMRTPGHEETWKTWHPEDSLDDELFQRGGASGV